MSYSICLKCEQTVGSYQKYCSECEKAYKQDKDFWRNGESYLIFSEKEARQGEIDRDKLTQALKGESDE